MAARTPKPAARVSSEDVARLAGVSRSTVSRVFTDGAYASADMRARVAEAARRLGYSPNALARGLITQRSTLVAVITGELGNPFYASILEVIADALQRNGRTCLLFVVDPLAIDTLIPRVLSYQVEGVILTEATLSSRMALRCQDADIPVVLVNRYLDSDTVTSIVGDNERGAGEVARHLVAQGCRRIAFMAGLPTASSSRDRQTGFERALAEHGIAPGAVEVGDYTAEGGARAARRLLAARPRPDAIFCANDVMAVATVDVARGEFGLRVPEDIAIAGYDNSSFAAMQAYDLTSVDQHKTEMAESAVAWLLDAGGAARAPAVRRIAPTLIVRASTRRRSD